MTTLVIFQRSADRVGERLRATAPDLHLLTLNNDGEFALDGQPVPVGDVGSIGPEIAWMNIDAFVSPQRDAFLKTLLDSTTLHWIQTAAAGVDSPIFGQLIDKGIRLTNSDAQAPSMADFVVGNVMAHLQNYPRRLKLQAEKRWEDLPFRELGRTRWLIVGYGSIGRETARRLAGFGCKVTGLRRTPQPDDYADHVGTIDELPSHLPDADVVLLSCALNDQTRGIVDADFLTRMKIGSILVNVGRGSLIDEPALLNALNGDRLEHAILDVFATEPLPQDDPLWTHPKVLVSSHASGFGDGLEERGDTLFLDNLRRFVAGETLYKEVTEFLRPAAS